MRLPYLLGFACIAALIGYALFLQEYRYLDPCPLCMTQRLAFYAMAAVFLIGGLHNPKTAASKVYASGVALFGLTGAALAGRHLYLQGLPEDQVPACGPGLEYLIENMPFAEVLRSMFLGDGNCAEVVWTFLGLSMPGWTLIWFLGLTIGGVYFGWKPRKHYMFHGR